MRVTVDDDRTNNDMIAALYHDVAGLTRRLDEFARQLRDIEMYVVTGVRVGALLPVQEPVQQAGLTPQYEPKMKAAYDEAKQKRENAK